VDACPDCRGLQIAYDRSVGLIGKASATVPMALVPRPDVLNGMVRTRARRQAASRVAKFMLPVAALLAVALWLATGFDPPAEGVLADRRDGALETTPALQVREGQAVESGDREAVISDPGTGRVNLAPRTRVRVQAWTASAASFLLEDGRLTAQVEHRSPGQSFEVHTEYAIVRVTGTRFDVVHHPGIETVVTVEQGEVQVFAASGPLIARLPAGGSLTVTAPGPGSSAPVRGFPAGLDVPPAPVRGPDLASLGVRPAAIGRFPRRASSVRGPIGEDERVTRALQLMEAGRAEEAVALLSGAAASDTPEHGRRFAALGDAQWLAGRHEEAQRAYELALAQWQGRAPEGLYLDLAVLLDDRLGRPVDAGAVWRRYLQTWPQGRYVGRALRELADLEEAAGRPDAARELRARLLADSPRSPEAADAYARLGRDLLDLPDPDPAARWFEARLDDPDRDVAEAALVGLMRVRMAQDRWDDMQALGLEHARRFDRGTRKDEVRRMLDTLPTREAGR